MPTGKPAGFKLTHYRRAPRIYRCDLALTRFDISRSPNPHVGFGAAGPHFCLGAHLARREITAILRELLHRVPGIRAAAPPDRLLSAFINGIKHLPCEFTS